MLNHHDPRGLRRAILGPEPPYKKIDFYVRRQGHQCHGKSPEHQCHGGNPRQRCRGIGQPKDDGTTTGTPLDTTTNDDDDDDGPKSDAVFGRFVAPDAGEKTTTCTTLRHAK